MLPDPFFAYVLGGWVTRLVHATVVHWECDREIMTTMIDMCIKLSLTDHEGGGGFVILGPVEV